jgi:hypothetical protein
LLAGARPRGGASPACSASRCSGVLGDREHAGEREGVMANPSERSWWRIGARDEAPRGGGGSGLRWLGNAPTQRERGRGKGHGRSLTTPGSCDGGYGPEMGGAGAVPRWRRSSVGGGGPNPGVGQRCKARGEGKWEGWMRLRRSASELRLRGAERSSACGSTGQPSGRLSRAVAASSKSVRGAPF